MQAKAVMVAGKIRGSMKAKAGDEHAILNKRNGVHVYKKLIDLPVLLALFLFNQRNFARE